MSRTPARFTQANVARALRAADDASAPRTVMIDAAGQIWLLPVTDAAAMPIMGKAARISAEREIVL
jgi:hypothetical protein